MTDQRTLPAGPGVSCVLHRYHSPVPASFDEHHAIPVSMGGPDVPSNLVVVCPTGHRNVHVCIAKLIRGGDVSDFGETTRALARRALAG